MSPQTAEPQTPKAGDGLAPLEDEELLAEIVRALVEHPGDVKVETTQKPDSTELHIVVRASDRRHIIGRQGRMIMMLRQLFGVIAARQNRMTVIELAESAAEREAHRYAAKK